MPFPQRSIPVLERPAPCGGLTGEPNLSLSKVQLYAGYPYDYRVRPLSYLTKQGQLVTDAQLDAFIETFHLKYSLSIFQRTCFLIIWKLYYLVPLMDGRAHNEGTTHGIVHAGFSGFRSFVARKKGRCKLIGNRLVIPHDTIP
jgi:hypothetical protein